MAGFQAISWFGLFAPNKTPSDIVAKLNADVQAILTNSKFGEQFLDPSYLQPLIGSNRQFAHYVEADAAKWEKVIKSANISIE
jgi:tripartite-type tricarboxylate transporter receptor subunit TctC